MISRFGASLENHEFTNLVYKEIKDQDYFWFKSLVEQMIGSMKFPPLLPDFRDAANRNRKAEFDKIVFESSAKWEDGEFNGLKKYLDSIGVKNVSEAIAKELKCKTNVS